MPRGGRRTGTPGVNYAQRTDLQAVRTAPSQQYGQRAAQERAQKALPLAGATDPGPSGAPAPAAGAPAAPVGPLPGMLTPLDAPTQRPDEPISAGLPMGPGAGPEALGPLGGGMDVSTELRAIYAQFPNEDLRALLEMLDDE